MTTSVDLGELQRVHKKAQARFKIAQQVVDRARHAYDRAVQNRNNAKEELDTAHVAVLNGARDVTQG